MVRILTAVTSSAMRVPCGHDHRALVLGELLVGALQAQLVATQDHDAALRADRKPQPR
jgi:hypothetical protein